MGGCAHESTSHACCGKHEHGVPIVAVSKLLGGPERDTFGWRVEMAKDPICGMDVDVKPGAIESTYQGKTYYFCSDGCKRTFDSAPQRYATV